MFADIFVWETIIRISHSTQAFAVKMDLFVEVGKIGKTLQVVLDS